MKNIRLSVEKELQHQGICDASGAIALDDQHFVVGNDEDNILRVYDSTTSGKPVSWGSHSDAGIDINSYFVNVINNKEADIEGAAQLDGIIYWITSHGRNSEGKLRPKRHQFFGNLISLDEEGQSLKQVGVSYTRLIEDMLQDDRLKHYDLEAAEKLPPKAKGGLNIEGLSATSHGELLIGFRNPISQGKALLLPLKNPQDLLEKENARAFFGSPIELDLKGLGIRSIDYWKDRSLYIIIAGAYDSGDQFSLYQWSELDEDLQEIKIPSMPSDFRPESVLFYPNQPNRFQILSDDGSIMRSGGFSCKDLEKDHPQKYFRSLWVREV